MKPSLLATVLLGLWTVSIVGCSKAPDLRDAQLYAQYLTRDSHFEVGGQHLVIPAVAMLSSAHSFALHEPRSAPSVQQRLAALPTDPNNPKRLDSLDIEVRQYQYSSPAGASICPLLARKWSQLICLGQAHGLLERLPDAFVLLDRTKLETLRNRYTVGRERQYDQIKTMTLRAGVTEVICDRHSQYCTAAVEVLPGSLAVWVMLWPDGKAGPALAASQGAALLQFVGRGLGPTEDPTLADAS